MNYVSAGGIAGCVQLTQLYMQAMTGSIEGFAVASKALMMTACTPGKRKTESSQRQHW